MPSSSANRRCLGSRAINGEVFTLAYTPTPEGVSELRWPARLGEWVAEGSGACVQETPGGLLVQAERRAERVELRVRGR